MKMIFIFIDGFGIGTDDEKINPICSAPAIRHIFNTFGAIPTDATLDVPGLPQSATGQTTIFTGVNASKVLGRHLNGRPTVTLKKLITTDNLFKELIKRGFKVTNSNTYRDEYLVKMLDSKDRRNSPSTTTVMTLSAGLSLRTVEDYKKGRGIYHDITGQIIRESGYDTDIITPEDAAGRLYRLSRDYDFTLYEHFMTDIIGHKMDMELALKGIELLDAFLAELLRLIDMDRDVIFVTSDHGNIEDTTVKTHTKNKVPTIIIGKVSEDIRNSIDSLTDIMPAVLKIFETRREEG